jgi:hypothetical protein
VQSSYSGTPLAKKLGIVAGSLLAVIAAPAEWRIPELPPEVRIRRATNSSSVVARADVVIGFCRTMSDVEKLALLALSLRPESALWVAWPRKAAGHVSEITDNLLRDALLPTGVVDVKVAALDDDWSGLKFVWRKENRRAE